MNIIKLISQLWEDLDELQPIFIWTGMWLGTLILYLWDF